VRAAPLLVLRALLVEIVVPLVMRLPTRRLEALLAPLGPPAPEERAEAIRNAVDRAFRFHPVKRTCLTRGVALCYLLRRSGFDVSLAFGLGPNASDWRGHCWLVREGRPYLERVDPQEHFAEMLVIPASGLSTPT
jgi:transglutaminase superfamily protein